MTPSIPYPMPWLPPIVEQITAYVTQVARDGARPLAPSSVRITYRQRKRRSDAAKPRAGGVPHQLLTMIRRHPGSTSRELREMIGVERGTWKGHSRALSEMVDKGVLRYTGPAGNRQYWEVK